MFSAEHLTVRAMIIELVLFSVYIFYVIRFVCRIKSLTILPNAIRPKEDGELLFLKKMETALWKAKYLCGKRGVVSRIQL